MLLAKLVVCSLGIQRTYLYNVLPSICPSLCLKMVNIWLYKTCEKPEINKSPNDKQKDNWLIQFVFTSKYPRYSVVTMQKWPITINICVPSGGRQCKRLVKAFEVFDVESRTWSSLPSLPCKRSYSGVLWDSAGRLCWLGGLRQGGLHQSSKFTKNVNIFDTNQGKLARHANSMKVCLLYLHPHDH